MNNDNQVTYFAETDSRNRRIRFGIKAEDRTRHVYVIGKTGMGKSTLLENMAIQDIQNGNGLAFLDPHGSTAEKLLEYVPEGRIKDVLYFAPFDMEYPVSFNVMEDVGVDKRHLVANGLMSAFKKIWVDAWSARMEYILGNTILALLEYPDSTLISINRMFADKDYRKKVVEHVTDPSVKSFWVDEFAKYTERFASEATPAIQNKVGQFISNPLVRNIVGQAKSTFDLREMMDEKKIIIINLSKGRMGEANANLLGSMLITKIYLAAMSRADKSRTELKNLPNFYLYVDEFQNFANESFADILSEARKYKLNLTVAHQYIEQMSDEVRAAVFGNVGTMITFRVGSYDAEVLEKEFAPQFTAEDIVNLDRFQAYLRLMIDGVGSQPFSAVTFNTPNIPEPNFKSEIIESSRNTYASKREKVEEDIKNWHQSVNGGKTNNEQLTHSKYGDERKDIRSNNSNHFRDNRRDLPKHDGRRFDNSQESRKIQNEQRTEFVSQNTGIKLDLNNQNTFPKNPVSRENADVHNNRSNNDGKKQEAFNRELELRKAVSLNYLKQRQESKKKEKGATPESLSALRQALVKIVGEDGLNREEKTKVIENSTLKTQETKPIVNNKSGPKEIPEAELRKILDVESSLDSKQS